MIGTGGAPNDKLCTKLNADYIKALPAAKHCKYGTTPDPCTSKIKGDLKCQCPTFINPANTAAVAELTKIEKEWNANGCKPSLTCLCANPLKGTCYAGPGGPANGQCSDN